MSDPMECASPTAAVVQAAAEAVAAAAVAASSPRSAHSSGSASTHSSQISSDSMRRRIASAMHELEQAQQALAESEANPSSSSNGDTDGRSGQLAQHSAAHAAAVKAESALSPTMRDTDEAALFAQLPDHNAHPAAVSAALAPIAAAAAAGGSESLGRTIAACASALTSAPLADADSDSDDDRVRPSLHAALGSSSDISMRRSNTDATSADCGSILTAPPRGSETQVDSDGLTPLQRHALQQASGKKEKGVSCHQCKTSKDGSVLLFCSNKGEKERGDKGGREEKRKKRSCRKKYCDACLRRAYNMSIDHFTQEEIDSWQCPACCRKCVCAACARKSDLALQATNKLAAAAVMQNALMHSSFGNMAGFNQLSLLHGMRPTMAMSMHMHMAAAAAVINPTPAAVAPVPAILPAVAVQAIPGAAVTSPFQFAQPATTIASSDDVQPHHARNGSTSSLSSHNSAHPGANMGAQAHAGVALAAAATSENALPHGRPRAYSCPTSPNQAAAQAYSFAPPVPAHAVTAHAVPAIPKPGPGLPHPMSAHMLQQRGLPMQPSREARTAQANMTEGTPQRRRRQSVKVTPMGSRSNASSRSGSPFPGATHSQPLTSDQYTLHMHGQTQDAPTDFSFATHNFSHHVPHAVHDAMQGTEYFEPPPPQQQQYHSAPVTPTSQRSRRGSAITYQAGPGMAVRAIDLSVHPPSSGHVSGQNSGPSSAQNSPRDSHGHSNHESGLEMQMMLISPFQQQQQSPFHVAQQSHPLHADSAINQRHGSGLHFMPSPSNQPMLSSPMQQQQQQQQPFHVSPNVSPQHQFAHSTLASYLHPINSSQPQQPHPSHLFASPPHALHPSELDLLSHGAPLSLDMINQLQASVQSELATKSHLEQQQRWQQQQQQRHAQEQQRQPQLEHPQPPESDQDHPPLPSMSAFADGSLELTAFVDGGGLDSSLHLDSFHSSLLDGSTPPHAHIDSLGSHGPHGRGEQPRGSPTFSFAHSQQQHQQQQQQQAKFGTASGGSGSGGGGMGSTANQSLPFLNMSPNTSPTHQQAAPRLALSSAPATAHATTVAAAAAASAHVAATGPVPSPPSSHGASAFHTGSPTSDFLRMSPPAKAERSHGFQTQHSTP